MTRALVLAALLAHASVAAADAPTQAGALFEQGQTHYAAGDYRAAIQLFDQAHALAPDAVYLFNIAQAYRKLFDCVRATDYYERYLAAAADADPNQREKIQEWLAELRPCVELRKRELEETRAAERERFAPTPQYVEHDPGRWYRHGGIAAAGAGAIGLAIGFVYAGRGADIEDELARTCATSCNWDATLEAKDRAGRRANTIAAVSWIAGTAALAGGVTLYVVGRSKKIERVQVSPTAGGASVSVRLTW